MKPNITFNIQDYPIEWVIFPTITINIPYRYLNLHFFKWYIEIDWHRRGMYATSTVYPAHR